MTVTALVIAILASAALGLGTWLAMVGAVTTATAGGVENDADRRDYRWFGAALLVIGLGLFVVGAIVGIEIMA